jgi:hypothetical protein
MDGHGNQHLESVSWPFRLRTWLWLGLRGRLRTGGLLLLLDGFLENRDLDTRVLGFLARVGEFGGGLMLDLDCFGACAC